MILLYSFWKIFFNSVGVGVGVEVASALKKFGHLKMPVLIVGVGVLVGVMVGVSVGVNPEVIEGVTVTSALVVAWGVGVALTVGVFAVFKRL